MNRWDGYGELYHHGILGQKWGVRRYQNEDGTLTDEGKIRYGKNLTKSEGTMDQLRAHDRYRRDTYKQVSKDVTEQIKYDEDRKKKEALGIAIKAAGSTAGLFGGIALGALTGVPLVGAGAALVTQMITNPLGNNQILMGRDIASNKLGYNGVQDMSEKMYNKKAKKAGMPTEEQYRKEYEQMYGTRAGMDSMISKTGKKLVNFYII